MDWSKAGYGKTASKSGGGKFEGLTKGGAPPNLPGKAGLGRVKGGIVSPTTSGNKGIPPKAPGKGSKAPKD
jgi:hypothetical protein